MNAKQLLFGLVAIAVVGLGLASYFVLWSSSGEEDMPDLPRYAITLSPNEHTLGNPKAPVQMVEYAAPTCPICARWDMTVFPSFRSAYIDSGKVFYVFRVFPLRPLDLAVEAVARCLPKSGYFPFIDMMYHNQSKWDPDGYQIPDVHAALIDMSKSAGLSAAEAEKCSNDQTVIREAGAAGEFAGKTYNINSTPSFIIDGLFHQQDVMTFERLQNFLDSELARKRSS